MALYVSRFMERKFVGHIPALDLDGLGREFDQWRNQSTAQRCANPYFGRNRQYEYALPDSEHALWHVHLQPAASDVDAMGRWALQFANSDEDKTSDSALIYTLSVDEVDALLLLNLGSQAHDLIPRSADGDKVLRMLGRTAYDWRIQPGKHTDDWRVLIP